MNPSGCTKQSDIKKWVKVQSDRLKKAVQDQSLERYVDRGSLPFAAVFCYESKTSLGNVELTWLLRRVDEEVERLKEIALRGRSLFRKKCIPVSHGRKSCVGTAKTQYRSIEECTRVHEAGKYLGAFKNTYFGLKPAKQDPEFKIILEWETAIWTYWMIYDACLKLAKKYSLVTASNVLDKFIKALQSFKKPDESIDTIISIESDSENESTSSDNESTPLIRHHSDHEAQESFWFGWFFKLFSCKNGKHKHACQAAQAYLVDEVDALKKANQQLKADLALKDEVIKRQAEELNKKDIEVTSCQQEKMAFPCNETEPPSPIRELTNEDFSTESHNTTIAQTYQKATETKVETCLQEASGEEKTSSLGAVTSSSGPPSLYEISLAAKSGATAVLNPLRRDLNSCSSLTFEVEEISDPRRPSEIAKRFQDLFNHSYDVGESLDSALAKLSQKFISKFILDMLIAVHRAATLTLEEKGKHIALALHMESHVDRPIAQKAVNESAVSLCRVMPAFLTSKIYDSVKTKAIDFQNWRKNVESAPTCVYTSADAFLEKCLPVFWDIALQRRPLVLVTDHKTFRPSQHERFYESDESNQIDYFVWPCLMEEATRKVLAKGRVVTKAKELTKPKDEAEPSKESDSAKPPFESPV